MSLSTESILRISMKIKFQTSFPLVGSIIEKEKENGGKGMEMRTERGVG